MTGRSPQRMFFEPENLPRSVNLNSNEALHPQLPARPPKRNTRENVASKDDGKNFGVKARPSLSAVAVVVVESQGCRET